MLNQLFYNRFIELNFKIQPHICQCNIAFMWYFYIIGIQYLHVRHPGKISPSELVSNGYISNHNKVRRPRPKFKVSFFLLLLFLNQCYSNKL